jgi:PAS domain S-box-containing protein
MIEGGHQVMRMSRLSRITANVYVVAVVLAAMAGTVRAAFNDVLSREAPYLPFIMAVTVAAWYGGLRPGLLASALGAVLSLGYFLPPLGSPNFEFGVQGAGLVLFLLSTAAISWLCESLRRSNLRVKSERAMRTMSDEFHAAIADLNSDFAYRGHFEADGAIIPDAVTEGFTRVLGYTPAEVQSLGGWRSLIHPDDLAVTDQSVRRLLRGETSEGELRMRAKDGRFVWLHRRNRPILDDRGRVTGAYGAAKDITEQKEAEDSLRDGEERLRLALDAGQMGVWDWNTVTNELKWTENLEPIHGLARGTFGGTIDAFRALIHPADRPRVEGLIARSLEQRTGYDAEFRIVTPDGQVRWIAGKGMVICDAEGNPVRMIGVGMDVNDRRQARETLAALLRISARVNATLDPDALLDVLVQEAISLVGAESGVAGLWTPEGMVCTRYFANGEPVPFEYRWPPLHGLPGWLFVHKVPYLTNDAAHDPQVAPAVRERFGFRSALSTPIVTSEGEILGFFEVHNKRDGSDFCETDTARLTAISQSASVAVQNALAYRRLKEAEQALIQADHRKEEFIATLAHELRNPLAPIRNAVEILGMKNSLDPDVAMARDVIGRQLRQMIRLVDDLLDVSRISRAQLQIRRERVECGAILRSAVETSRPLIDSGGQRLRLSVPDEPVYLDADAARLAQVVSNLLNNAAKYTPAGGLITLTAAAREGTLTISVRDTGVGIAPEHLPRVFDLFSQVDPALERSAGGLGIGLSLVRSLVELHGGTVEARSEGRNRGSEFVVRLPGVQTRTRPRETPVDALRWSPGAQSDRRRVLVVDDNQDSTTSLADLLRRRGHDVQTAYDGVEAIAVYQTFAPDVVLLDIGLPKLNGYEVARRLRQLPSGARVLLVAVTGWGQSDDRLRSREAGFDHHLVKPVSLAAFETLLTTSGATRLPV